MRMRTCTRTPIRTATRNRAQRPRSTTPPTHICCNSTPQPQPQPIVFPPSQNPGERMADQSPAREPHYVRPTAASQKLESCTDDQDRAGLTGAGVWRWQTVKRSQLKIGCCHVGQPPPGILETYPGVGGVPPPKRKQICPKLTQKRGARPTPPEVSPGLVRTLSPQGLKTGPPPTAPQPTASHGVASATPSTPAATPPSAPWTSGAAGRGSTRGRADCAVGPSPPLGGNGWRRRFLSHSMAPAARPEYPSFCVQVTWLWAKMYSKVWREV